MEDLSHADAEIEESLRAILEHSITGRSHPAARYLPVPLNDLQAHRYLTTYYQLTDLGSHFLRARRGEESNSDRSIDALLSAVKSVTAQSATVTKRAIVQACKNLAVSSQNVLVDVRLANEELLAALVCSIADRGYLTTADLRLTDPGDRIRKLAGDTHP